MENIILWFRDLIVGFGGAVEWLTTPIWNNFSPLSILTFSGLSLFLIVAIGFWVVK